VAGVEQQLVEINFAAVLFKIEVHEVAVPFVRSLRRGNQDLTVRPAPP